MGYKKRPLAVKAKGLRSVIVSIRTDTVSPGQYQNQNYH